MSFFIMTVLFIVLDIVTAKGIIATFPQFGVRRKRSIRTAFLIQALFASVIVLSGFFLSGNVRDYRMYAVYYYLFGLTLAIYLPKGLFVLFLIFDRLAVKAKQRRRHGRTLYPRKSRHIPAKCGIAVCLLFMILVAWGILFGRYNYTIEPVEIRFAELPSAFDGYKIIQFSDVHAGSFFGAANRFRKAVEMINAENPDLIVFTGDMVNNFADEAAPLIPVFSQLKARDGKYAILGNHDYGGYYRWNAPADSVADHAKLENAIESMGFRLLKNQAVTLAKDSVDRVALIGVENWGVEKRHPKRGDLAQAGDSVRDVPFKILLSHDPSHWSEKIAGKTDIALTLSGHTHGMQMGIRFGKYKYSPGELNHRYWIGLYRAGDQYLYINRGLGVIGYPGRIGMSPEITLITLRKQ